MWINLRYILKLFSSFYYKPLSKNSCSDCVYPSHFCFRWFWLTCFFRLCWKLNFSSAGYTIKILAAFKARQKEKNSRYKEHLLFVELCLLMNFRDSLAQNNYPSWKFTMWQDYCFYSSVSQCSTLSHYSFCWK